MPFFFGGDVFPNELGVFLWSALFTVAIAILLTGRAKTDPEGVRVEHRYYALVCLITLFVALFATFGAVRALTDLAVDHEARFQLANPVFEEGGESSQISLGFTPFYDGTEPSYFYSPNNDANYTAIVRNGLVALTAGAIFGFHFRSRRAATAKKSFLGSPGARVERVYLYGVCLIAALVIAYATARSLFGIFEIAAPGVATGDGHVGTGIGVSDLLSYGVLALGGGAIFAGAWRQVPAD